MFFRFHFIEGRDLATLQENPGELWLSLEPASNDAFTYAVLVTWSKDATDGVTFSAAKDGAERALARELVRQNSPNPRRIVARLLDRLRALEESEFDEPSGALSV